jgi:hypothetical protein
MKSNRVLILLIVAAGYAFAASAENKEWLVCEKDADCTSVELGCSYWQPVNKKYVTEMKTAGPAACLKSVPVCPQPTPRCADQVCVNNPLPFLMIGSEKKQIFYPIYSWALALESYIAPYVPRSMPQSEIYVTPNPREQGKREGPVLVKGQAWEAVISSTTYRADPGKKFDQYYRQLYQDYLLSQGPWKKINPDENLTIHAGGYDFDAVQADGPNGSTWGYLFQTEVNLNDFRKTMVRELILSYTLGTNAEGTECDEASCTYVRYIIFWSDAINLGELLDRASVK